MGPEVSRKLHAGLEHHRSGRLQQAEAAYQSILGTDPKQPDALHLMGVIAHQVGKHEIAVRYIEAAIGVSPDVPDFHNNCGEAYRAMGRHDEAIACYRRAITVQPDFFGGHNNLGNALKESGRVDDAIACYEKALAINPGFAEAHNNLGIAFRELGRHREAVDCFEKALGLQPGYAEAHNNLGNALVDLGRYDDAVASIQRALDIHAGYAEAHSNMGNALRRAGRPENAVEHYRRALALRPDFAMAHYNLGIVMDELALPAEAVASYQRAIAIEPGYAEAHNNLGNALNELGRDEEAVRHFETAIAIRPDYAEAHRNLTRLRPERGQLPVINELLARDSLPEADAIHCHFAIGNIHNDAGRYDEAFEHYHRGNTLKHKALTYSATAYSSYLDRLIGVYSKEYFQSAGNRGSNSELPVFILGMPRSGTTLVEQIVSSHPQVHGAGELVALLGIEDAIAKKFETVAPYPECMPRCEAPLLLECADGYLAELKRHSDTALRVTDKMPANFIRIGLIKTLFPGARIIHCRRCALDTCISNYLHYFATGNDYAFDLEDLGRYYLDYERIMAHWNGIFGSEILTVQYETLVTNQEQTSRLLIDYLGLEWDDRCLEFHTSTRAVNTFSSEQVRRPVYTHAIDRWKRYEKHLAPLVAMLQEDSRPAAE